MNDIVVFGSLNMDLVVRTERAPLAGETLTGKSFDTIPGGKGANQAAAIAKLGGGVALIGRVGRDNFGERITRGLDEMGVDTSHLRADTQSTTGIALIVVEANGENRILLIPGANGRLDTSDIQASVTLLREARLLVLQLEVPINIVSQVIDLAIQHHVPILLNAAPATPLPDGMLAKIDYLVINEHEARALSGTEVTDPASAMDAARLLIARGAKVVIVTIGAQGAVVVSEDTAEHIPAFKVQAVDTTAAGDAFIGGFAIARMRQLSLLDAVRYGSAAGAMATTRPGAQTSLPMREEVERVLARG